MTPDPKRRDRPDVEIDAELESWVTEVTGRSVISSEPMAPGLGHRRFFRLTLSGSDAPTTLIARIDPPEGSSDTTGVAAEPENEPIRALLEQAGLPVPRCHGRDAIRGWDLLEDVGDTSLEAAARAADDAERWALYHEAVGLLPRLQAVTAPSPSIPAFERRLDSALIATKARKVIEWLLPEALGRTASAVEHATVEHAFAEVARVVDEAPLRLSHRDFKAANLHLRPNADADPNRPRLVLIDLQGAFLAPPEYDLVCLLRDSHFQLPASEVDAHLRDVRPRLPDAPSSDEFQRRFDLLTLTRVGKDLAHYLNAARERQDMRYLPFVATGFAKLRAASERLREEHPALLDLARMLRDLPLPPICTAGAPEATSCAR